jgi:hypothetical protein
MSEQVTRIQPVSSRVLMRAVVRLNSEKHPAKIEAIQEEIERRKGEEWRKAA